MPKGGLRSTSFKPGVSGNPAGRPKRPDTIEARRVVADVKSAARELTPVAMGTLEKAMTDQKAPWGHGCNLPNARHCPQATGHGAPLGFARYRLLELRDLLRKPVYLIEVYARQFDHEQRK
jgi:hypothetical protein